MRFYRISALILAGCLVMAGCKKKEEPVPPPPPEASTAPATPEVTPAAPAGVTVSSIDLGKAVGADHKVSEPTATFGPKDTIYAAVSTTGTAASTAIKARWTYGDNAKLVKEDTVTIQPTGNDTTDVSISNPKGWPAGKYRLEISIDGTAAGTKDFEVQK
jgi:hypothetical protein